MSLDIFGLQGKTVCWLKNLGLDFLHGIGQKIGETLYSINALPFGGFVRLHGEQDEGGIMYPRKAFLNKSKG